MYETDLVLWSETQGQLLRQMAARGSNEAIDWENVAEEIETMGRSQAASVTNRMARVIEHLLKLQFSPATAPRRLWAESIRTQRLRIDSILGDSPSLRARLDEVMDRATKLGTAYAVEALLRHGEDSAIEPIRQHGGRYSVAEIIEDWLPPGEPPPAD